MKIHNLKAFRRRLKKRKFYFFFSLISLAIASANAIVISLWAQYELSFYLLSGLQ